MTTPARLIDYPVERAIEHAAFHHRVTPTHLFGVMFPVWCVEITATVTYGEPYELIDRHIERAIAHGRFHTAADLAAFLALDEPIVNSALRFLRAIHHLREVDGGYLLTELGLRSVRDDTRYVVTKEDRRKLYFDAYTSRPLTAPHYDSRKVTFFAVDEAAAAATQGWPRYTLLHSMEGFRRDALRELASHRDRATYNLPERIDNPESRGETYVYLPMYVVTGTSRQGRTRHLAYTTASDQGDRDLTEVVENTLELASAMTLSAKEAVADRETQAEEWLRRNELSGGQLRTWGGGGLRVTLPAASFGSGKLSLTKLGSFQVYRTNCFHIWCNDLRTRQRALLERVDNYLAVRTRIDPDAVADRIAWIAQQLELGNVDTRRLRELAAQAGRQGLVSQLDRFS